MQDPSRRAIADSAPLHRTDDASSGRERLLNASLRLSGEWLDQLPVPCRTAWLYSGKRAGRLARCGSRRQTLKQM